MPHLSLIFCLFIFCIYKHRNPFDTSGFIVSFLMAFEFIFVSSSFQLSFMLVHMVDGFVIFFLSLLV
uniref:Uncharacterized protein n=1 Tax=Rhizophora mucronata TaxID=61149 RepID=A0A2P2JN16_RHIMU